MHGLVHGLALAVFIRFAKRGRGQHAERTCQHGGDIGQHVAEQIVSDNDVELLGPAHELHAQRICQHVIELHICIFALVQGADDFVPKHAGFHHIALFRRGHFVTALARQLKSDATDALDFVSVIDLRIDAALLAIAEIDDFFRLAKIDATCQLAHDHNVEAFDNLALERGIIRQSRIADRRAQIGEETQILAQTQQARFRAHIVRHAVPFRTADCAKNDRVAFHRELHVAFADGLAMRIIGRTAHEARLALERGDPLLAKPIGHFDHFGHDFRANAVAGQKKEFVRRHGRSVALMRKQARLLAFAPRLGNSPRKDAQKETAGAFAPAAFHHRSWCNQAAAS